MTFLKSILQRIFRIAFPKKAILKRHTQVFSENEKVQTYFEQEKATKRNKDSKLDDYNWELYTLHYKGEIEEVSKDFSVSLNNDDYAFEEGALSKKSDDKPLHPNWHTIYEAILKLNPTSVLELGCGNGMHLSNLQVLDSTMTLIGLDRSQNQLEFLKQLHPTLNASLHLADATLPFPKELPRADLGYTQAVIMHIQTAENHKKALVNLFNNSEKYVVLMENWTKHPFLEDIKELQTHGAIEWEKIYFYSAPEPVTNKPHAMVCSKTPLTNFEELKDYGILLG
jgi:SAM-dependent methyltransferase